MSMRLGLGRLDELRSDRTTTIRRTAWPHRDNLVRPHDDIRWCPVTETYYIVDRHEEIT